ncbi:family 10 glycosylhydrolase [Thermostichus vulcanus]|uniref:family 10 glycosylhydrolase n=1 Tax=Thermostichus vulcanus TaxID=32053 RepID=UPI001FCB7074
MGRFWVGLGAVVAFGCSSAVAGPLPEAVWGDPSCGLPEAERLEKQRLLEASSTHPEAAEQYRALIGSHAQHLQACRAQTWPQTQAVWLRLYDTDALPGVLDEVLDRIVNRGYNQVFVETFYDGRVLLPEADNPTPWRSVLQEAVAAGILPADTDLLAEVIEKGHARGLQVHAWMFAMNFGYSFSERADRAPLLARNGWGETSIAQARFDPGLLVDGQAFYEDAYETEHLFVDPYHPQARQDLITAITAILARQPDGILLDYIRFPTAVGADKWVSHPHELWIHAEASRSALLDRMGRRRERELMHRYLQSGFLSAADVAQVDSQYADEPLPSVLDRLRTHARRAQRYEAQFWQQAVDHALQGVIDFLAAVAEPVLAEGIPVAAVFFPGGNRIQAGAYNAKLQPWDRFPAPIERHPMSYAICGDNNATCVADQVGEVISKTPVGTPICPVLAGTWGQPFGGHASLEIQMETLKSRYPQLECVSHFVYSWMEPDSDRDRKFRLQAQTRGF